MGEPGQNVPKKRLSEGAWVQRAGSSKKTDSREEENSKDMESGYVF